MPGNYMNLVFLLIIVGASVISWIFRKIQEEAARRAAREEIARRELDRLRTGREPGAEVESADQLQRAQELQARRQAQLQELRRRQQERAREQPSAMHIEEARIGPAAPGAPASSTPAAPPRSAPPTRQTPLVWIPGSSGPTVPQRTLPGARRAPSTAPPSSRPQARARPGPRPVRPEPQPTPRKSVFATSPPSPPPALIIPANESDAALAVKPGRRRSELAPRTAGDWRRAIIMHEILSPPLALRFADDRASEAQR